MYSPVFQDYPDDWQGWWPLIRRYVERTYDVALPVSGRVTGRARRLKSKLQRPLPPSIVEWLALVDDVSRCCKAAESDFWEFSKQGQVDTEEEFIILSRYYGCRQWGVRLDNLDEDDPPVGTYEYVQNRDGFVYRKSRGQVPVTQFALHMVINHAWSGHSAMGNVLRDPKAFANKLAAKINVSKPYGSLRFAEGTGWIAFIRNGYGIHDRDKHVTIRFGKGATFDGIPKLIRDKVGMKPSVFRRKKK